MRCLSLAAALTSQGADVRFVSSDINILPFTDKAGYTAHILNSAWDDKNGEIKALTGWLKEESIDTVFIDSYSVTAEYFAALKEAGIHVMYIDDLCKEAYPVDAMVNYCPAAVSLGYEKMYPPETKLLLGPGYIPLREQFTKGLRSKGDALLITAGGSDSMGLTDLMIRGVIAEHGLGYDKERLGRIRLLAGRYYHPSDYIKEAVEKGRVILYQNVDNVAQIMSECGAAVSSAGTTLFELSAIGVITASFVFVDNQMIDALYFDEAGLMPYAGDFRESPDKCMERIIEFLYKVKSMSDKERERKSNALYSLIDGQGANRIAAELISLADSRGV